MKAFALILFSALFFPVVGQVDDDIRRVGEFDPRHGCETLEAGLDSLFAVASNDSPSTAYVVILQGDNGFDNAIVHRKANSYVRIRGFPIDRYVVLLTKGNGDIRVGLWIGKNGKVPPVVSTDLDVNLRYSRSRILILEDTIEIVRHEGRETYVSHGNASCLYAFGSSTALELLKVNARYDAEFLIRTKSSKTYRRLVAILRREFIEAGAPIERVKFVYGGRDKEIGGGSKLASVETSFVKNVRK